MDIVLFDRERRVNLFPLTLTRAVADLRFGILTIKERWEKILKATAYISTVTYLQPLYEPLPSGEILFVDATIIPSAELVELVKNLEVNNAIEDEAGLVAARMANAAGNWSGIFEQGLSKTIVPQVKRLTTPADIFLLNDEMIRYDFALLTKGRISCDFDDTVHVKKMSQIFVEEGANVDHSILNATSGPIYISKGATIMEGCLVRGPFAIAEGAVLKMGTKVYGATTIGPYCTAGGEIKNSVMTGYSNKAHDGYLGDSVIGEWCNIGAGTTNSNVKNTGGDVKLWNDDSNTYTNAGMKCGVIIGDYTRTAINTSINTGTVIGVCSNVFGEGLTPKFIPGFSWGTRGEQRYEFEKAVKDIDNWKKMKNKSVLEKELQVLKHIFEGNNC
jgi:UDP-N-acetylglucosamine diphosphorylase/glucosamine-1-phosphate N-acetyltransferase